MAEAHSPLEQFHIKRLVDLQIGGVDISFTNSSLWMFIAIAAVTLFLTLGSRNRALVPGRGQSMAEMSYEFVANMLRDNVGSEGRKYFPFIFTLFMFVLFANLAGMLPYSFTTTSHIVVTFAMALFVWLLTLHPAASGRVFAAYGGIYVATALVWLRVVDGVRLSLSDWAGAGLVFAGALVILAQWQR